MFVKGAIEVSLFIIHNNDARHIYKIYKSADVFLRKDV
jgi:hypothetical protein